MLEGEKIYQQVIMIPNMYWYSSMCGLLWEHRGWWDVSHRPWTWNQLGFPQRDRRVKGLSGVAAGEGIL